MKTDEYLVFCCNEIDPQWQFFTFDTLNEARTFIIDYMADMQGYSMSGQCFIYDVLKGIVVDS